MNPMHPDSSSLESMLSGETVFDDGMPVIVAVVRTAVADATGHNTVDAQLERIESACAQRFPEGYHLVASVEEGRPAGPTSTRGMRQRLQQIAELAEKGVVQYICATGLDRISRSARECSMFMECLRLCGVPLLTLNRDGVCDNTGEPAMSKFQEELDRLLKDSIDR